MTGLKLILNRLARYSDVERITIECNVPSLAQVWFRNYWQEMYSFCAISQLSNCKSIFG